ncbi:probable palmitoyltransferase ZDHHC24 [Drosophila novamexicana]|uniref:probable palmitoyltransferase ZDHHC24 n=1 Tax=Drosophila novamexicana TaxID=47314 RepID=UPI0011E5D7FD|nr:probable palmitoyltransferase ZDHHC24 [Drosophila novamexicana]
MVKIPVRVLRQVCRSIIYLETSMWRFIKQHRVRIIRILHPLSAALLLLAVGFFFIYEMFYILPEICDTSGIFYNFNWLLCAFLLHNIAGNMIMCWRTDTSFMVLPKSRQHPLPTEAHLWHLCTHCQMLVPPRAWHCRLCNCCMLKRDHHCNVTANCVGHLNQRYFVALLFHLSLGCGTAFVYNVYHLWSQRQVLFSDPIGYLGLSMGLRSLSFPGHNNNDPTLDSKLTWLIINGGVIKLNIFAMILASSHLILQLIMISRGSCLYFVRDRSYDFGFWQNLQLVLGKRLFWTMLSPLVPSPLPHDGTQWQQHALEQGAKKPV